MPSSPLREAIWAELPSVLAIACLGGVLFAATLMWCEPEACTVDDIMDPHLVGGR